MHALWHRFTEARIFSEGEEPEVDSSSFTNTLTFLTSSDIITIYVPRVFQRAASHPPILQHVRKAVILVRLGRNPAICYIRSGHSSHALTSWQDIFIPNQKRACQFGDEKNLASHSQPICFSWEACAKLW